MLRLGVVSFLNSRPLVEGLAAAPGVECVFDVPAALAGRLERGEVDVALVPVFDVLRAEAGRYRVVPDACIGCDGETMTVRVFSQVAPDRMTTLWVDPDSHTSVALARILWMDLYGRELTLRPLPREERHSEDLESVLLIGDKVVDPGRGRFAYEVDLGGAWRQHTGLPFVFAVWARSADAPVAEGGFTDDAVGAVLNAARDRGVAIAGEIAQRDGPALGWPVALAQRYLTRCLRYTLDERMMAGARLFAQRCADLGLISAERELAWPVEPVAASRG